MATSNSPFIQIAVLIFLNVLIVGVSCGANEDLRCSCTCASFKNVSAKIYKRNVLHEDCNCLKVVVSRLTAGIIAEKDMEAYCYLCDCKFEVRSTKTMQVVVYIFLVVLGILVIYMLIMLIVDLIMNKIGDQSPQHRLLEGDQVEMTATGRTYERTRTQSEPTSGRSVFQRVNLVQSRWKKQVQEQRSSVFERQEILH